MKYDCGEISYALRVIKEICDEVDCGVCCPFYGGERGCLIRETLPELWSINDEPPEHWKGLL